jgi:ribosomal 30S subunit maturation factor RimM
MATTAEGLPSFVNPAGLSESCEAEFIWHTIYGCPVCNEEDYSVATGECKDGKQLVYYFL